MNNIVDLLRHELTNASEQLLAANGFSQIDIQRITAEAWNLEVIANTHVDGDLCATGAMKMSAALKTGPGTTAEMLCRLVGEEKSDVLKRSLQRIDATNSGFINLKLSPRGRLSALSSVLAFPTNGSIAQWQKNHPYAQHVGASTQSSRSDRSIQRCIKILNNATQQRFDVYQNVELPPLIECFDKDNSCCKTHSLEHDAVSDTDHELILYAQVMQADIEHNSNLRKDTATALQASSIYRHADNLAKSVDIFFNNNSASTTTERSTTVRLHLIYAIADLLARAITR